MRFEATALYRSIICSCCRTQRVDKSIGKNQGGREDDDTEDDNDNFIDNPVNLKVSHDIMIILLMKRRNSTRVYLLPD